MNDTSCVSREAQARIRESLGVKLPGATQPSAELPFINIAAYLGSNRTRSDHDSFFHQISEMLVTAKGADNQVSVISSRSELSPEDKR